MEEPRSGIKSALQSISQKFGCFKPKTYLLQNSFFVLFCKINPSFDTGNKQPKRNCKEEIK